MSSPRLDSRETAPSHVGRQDASELASPKDWRSPEGIPIEDSLSDFGFGGPEKQIGEQVDIGNDHARPAWRAALS